MAVFENVFLGLVDGTLSYQIFHYLVLLVLVPSIGRLQLSTLELLTGFDQLAIQKVLVSCSLFQASPATMNQARG